MISLFNANNTSGKNRLDKRRNRSNISINLKMGAKSCDLEQQYKQVKGLKKEDVDQMYEWLDSQPHLPKISERDMILFLSSCHFSNEAAKKTIDCYYTMRTHCPEFFADQRPLNASIKETSERLALAPMPQLTPEGYTVLYNRLIDMDPAHFIFNNSVKFFDMMWRLHLHERGALRGHVIIIDFDGAQVSHLLRVGPLGAKKLLHFLQETLPFRLVQCHFVNAVPFMDKVMALLRPFMKKELLDVLEIHYGDNATILPKIPAEYLPKEAHGKGPSIFQVHRDFYEKMCASDDFYKETEGACVDESKCPGKPKNAGELFGVEGTFKRLDID